MILLAVIFTGARQYLQAQQQTMPGSPSAGEPAQTATPASGSPGNGAQAAPPASAGSAGTPAGDAAGTSTPAAAAVTASPEAKAAAEKQAAAEKTSVSVANATLAGWKGLRVESVAFQGVTFDAKDPLPGELPQQAGQPLDPAKVTQSIRKLFASGRYRDIRVTGRRLSNSVVLTFVGTARYFVGRVQIVGVKEERLASLLEYATKLQPGTAFTQTMIAAGTDGVKQSLASSGYFQPSITPTTTVDEVGKQVNVTYSVNIGPQARVGQVALQGDDPGMTLEEFRKKGKLKQGTKVNRETVSNALSNLRTVYEKKDRLEATTSLRKQTYSPDRKQLDYDFNANQGPIVKVLVEGIKVSKSRLKLLVPIYEEGTVDNDLINEGTFNIKDFLFQQGYFDATVSSRREGVDTASESVIFTVDKGVKHKVGSVTIVGNKYFETDLLKERMQVQKADLYLRNGRYSPQLMKSDEASILDLYRANGFSSATATAGAKDVDTSKSGKKLKLPEIAVTVTVTEGPQQKFGSVAVAGVDPSRQKDVQGLLASQTGQPYSLITLSGDRDAILGYYLSHGFAEAKIEVKQNAEGGDAHKTDVSLNVTEGKQVFVDKVLVTGIVHTRPAVVEKRIKVHAGDPLNQTALLNSQRGLYDLALFNEVNTAIQDPDGDDVVKNVLVQLTEARRWDVTYGFGFEAQTGTPAVVPGGKQGQTAAQNGKAGVSPRVTLDVSRINLRGSTQSLTLHTTYGLLERVATLTYNVPQFEGHPHLDVSISAGYSNVENITTFQASVLQGDVRMTQKVKRADNFIYDFQYRRVSVNADSLEITANLIPQLSEPVTVGGPGITYFHDTRDPTPLDAQRGQYFSAQDFISDSVFGAETNFNRVDLSHSSYYTFGKRRKYTIARSTRVGFENTLGSTNSSVNSILGVANCEGTLLTTNATCNPIPLPERLYAGGANSHRGFGINDAGPRDLTTGYPVGGSAVVVNSVELRLPPPVLPIVGDNVSFVGFWDMGNVFRYPGDMFKSIKNFHQPNESQCEQVPYGPPPAGETQQQYDQTLAGVCSFNYYSHAVGLGARYKTPVGPIRIDFSYNLNPPVYPVYNDYTNSLPYVGRAGHFNFFFGIGQSF
jgi:outer membrane protein insertion porin family